MGAITMVKCGLFLGVISIIFSTLCGCNNESNKISVSLDEQFSLYVGQTAEISGEQLEITFEDVLEDSRCPTGAMCIWTGRVSCLLKIIDNENTKSVVLIELGSGDKNNNTIYDGRYKITFHILPYPELGKQISKEEYRLQLTWSEVPQLTDIVGTIIATPNMFKDQEINIIGFYRGWDLLHEVNISPPITRSDWVIKDTNGAIYVNANSIAKLPDGLNPGSLEDTNAMLKVTGIVHVTNEGQPYIDATNIESIS
jgi:hypothetical protein